MDPAGDDIDASSAQLSAALGEAEAAGEFEGVKAGNPAASHDLVELVFLSHGLSVG